MRVLWQLYLITWRVQFRSVQHEKKCVHFCSHFTMKYVVMEKIFTRSSRLKQPRVENRSDVAFRSTSRPSRRVLTLHHIYAAAAASGGCTASRRPYTPQKPLPVRAAATPGHERGILLWQQTPTRFITHTRLTWSGVGTANDSRAHPETAGHAP